MKIQFLILFTIISIFCFGQNKQNFDLYILPRNPEYGWLNNIFKIYEFKKMSYKVSYDERSYFVKTVKDSLYELFYTNINLDIDSIFIKDIVNEKFFSTRIVLINSNIDSIFIDKYYTIKYKKKSYKINPLFKKQLHNIMPAELRENWELDLYYGEYIDN